VTDRKTLGRRNRAMLDHFSAHTNWPTDKGPKNERAGRDPFGQVQMGEPWHRHRDRQAADDLAEPPQMGAVPAPGADIAPGDAGFGALHM
jgi:hypothetical protein